MSHSLNALIRFIVLAGFASMTTPRGALAQSGCGYVVAETLPNGPVCGFDPYTPHILDIADDGTVCGYASAFPCPDRAFTQSPGGPLVFLPAPSGAMGARALCHNTQGLVVGYFNDESNHERPCKWVAGICVPLALLRGADSGEAAAVNSRGDIAGFCNNVSTGPQHACLWIGNSVVDRHPGAPWLHSDFSALNDSGNAVGTVHQGANQDRAFVCSPNADYTILPAIPGGVTSGGVAIDAQGDVIGFGFTGLLSDPQTLRHAYIWRGGQMIDLGQLPGQTQSDVFDVTDEGTVAGYSYSVGQKRLFLWKDGFIAPVMVNGTPFVGTAPRMNNSRLLTSGSRRLAPTNGRQGDVNQNCRVDVNDLLAVIVFWGSTVSSADVNHDGIVDVIDLWIVLNDWG